MAFCKSIYTGSAFETIERIREGKDVVTVGKHYKHSKGWYWYVNQKGFYHVLQLVAVKLNGEIFHYAIKDSLVTKDNKLKETKVYGHYKSPEEVIKAIEQED